MNYRLLQESKTIRGRFLDSFIQPYSEFVSTHSEWIASLRTAFNRGYYDSMFMWDRLKPGAREISFADALTLLKSKMEEVYFLAEVPKCTAREFCRLNSRIEFTAAAVPGELAECICYEWFTEYELFEQGCYLADPILPSDLYVFDETYSWCIIFTHETDETESAESRFCLCIGNIR